MDSMSVARTAMNRFTDDKIQILPEAVIQHGPHSNRVYLMQLTARNVNPVIEMMEALAFQNSYTKIFARVCDSQKQDFLRHGYHPEAAIPAGITKDAQIVFMAKYLSPKRAWEQCPQEIKAVLSAAASSPKGGGKIKKSKKWKIFRCQFSDVDEISRLYRRVFQSYPFPIDDPSYLAQAMQKNYRYYAVRKKKRIIAIAAAEIDHANRCAEMTDFATLNQWRRQGLAKSLLAAMESEMAQAGILTAYTIARSLSWGMNKTFSDTDYTYAGTLTNNTNISGGIQSMNVWYKKLLLRGDKWIL
jgi:putative beta-lysine N-acetyltransferase